MIDSDRGPYGDRMAAWARICDEFPETRDRAVQFQCEQRLDALVESVRRGEWRIVLWHALLGEIADRAADQRLMTWRDLGQPAAAWPSALDPDGIGFVCPEGRCSRRAAASIGERPRCPLLDRDMTDLSDPEPAG
jgi:hypothetical protein